MNPVKENGYYYNFFPEKATRPAEILEPDSSKKETPLNDHLATQLTPKTFKNDITLLVLSYLDPKTLHELSKVKEWEVLANDPVLWNSFDLKRLSPKLTVFNECEWKAGFNLEVLDAPKLDMHQLIVKLYDILDVLEPHFPSLDNAPLLTFMTVPKGVDLSMLIKLSKDPKKGNATQFASLNSNFCSLPASSTYHVAITQKVFKNTLNKSGNTQRVFLKRLGFQMPYVLEVLMQLVVTNATEGRHLYNDNGVCTRCSDSLNGTSFLVGDYGNKGINIFWNNWDCEKFGSAGVWRYMS